MAIVTKHLQLHQVSRKSPGYLHQR